MEEDDQSEVIFSTKGIDNNKDVILGTPNDDNISGTNLAETISGEAGNDNINGNGGADILFGGAGRWRTVLVGSSPLLRAISSPRRPS